MKPQLGFGILFLFLCAAYAQAQTDPPADEPVVQPPSPEVSPKSELPLTAYTGAEVRTLGSAGTISNGTVLVQGSKILAVGDASLEIPEKAVRVDLSGTILTPGLIDARSELWLTDPSSSTGSSDGSLNIVDGIDPFDEAWHEVIRHGVTSVYIQPGRSGTLGGVGAVISVAPAGSLVQGNGLAQGSSLATGEKYPTGASPSEIMPSVIAAQAAMQASVGVGASSNRTRQQQIDSIKKVLEAADDYQKKVEAYEKYIADKKAAADKEAAQKKPSETEAAKETAEPARSGTGRPGGRGTPRPDADQPKPDKPDPDKPDSDKKDGEGDKNEAEKPDGDAAKASGEEKKASDEKPPKKPTPDPTKDKLVRVLKGELPLRLEVNTPDDIAFAQTMLGDEKFQRIQVIYEGLSDLRASGEQVVASNAPVVLGPWLSLEARNNATLNSEEHWVSLFRDYPGVVVIGSFASSGQGSRMLRAHAAEAIAHGFTANRALQAITVDAARVLGVVGDVGTIEPGKRADLVSFVGEPTDPSSPVNLVVSNGQSVYREEKSNKLAGPATAETTAESVELPETLPNSFALRSSRCLVGGKLQAATLLVRDGKIASISMEAADPEGVPFFDLGSRVVTPGLFSCQASLGLERLLDSSDTPDSSFVNAADCFASDLRSQQPLIDDGLLRVLLAPGDTNPVAGTVSLIRLGASEPVSIREVATKFVLTAGARNPDRFPASLVAQSRMLQQALDGTLLESRLYAPTSVRENLSRRREMTLKSTASGERPSVFEVSTDAEIRTALDLIERNKLKAALLGPQQLRPFIDRMRALEVALIIKPVGVQTYNWFSEDVSAAAAAGIPIFLAGENAEQLRLTAACAGLPRDKALVALCDPGLQLDANWSAWQVDSPADFVVWSDSPVNMAAKPLSVIVDGKHASKRDVGN